MLSDNYRTTESSMQSSDQDVTPSKPTGLASRTKAIVHPTATAVSEDDEPDTLTEAEEIDDDLEYSTSLTDTLVRPCIPSYGYPLLTTPQYRSPYCLRQLLRPQWLQPIRRGLAFDHCPQTCNNHSPMISFHTSLPRWAALHPLGQTSTLTLFKAM